VKEKKGEKYKKCKPNIELFEQYIYINIIWLILSFLWTI